MPIIESGIVTRDGTEPRGGDGAAHGSLPAEAATLPAAWGLGELLPVLIVLPNAIYGLWLMRNIGRTHTNPES